MTFDLTGPRVAALAASLLVSVGLSACTTTEGTNAFTSPQTFESAVLTSTAQGLGLIPTEVKPDPTNARGPLVLPKDNKTLPPPAKDDVEALLPADSTDVKFNSGINAGDLERVRHARVVSLSTPDGRPLTEAEVANLTARLKSGYKLSDKRSIFVPPEQYFRVGSATQDLVCLAANGDLVAVNDPSCPIEIRKALLKKT